MNTYSRRQSLSQRSHIENIKNKNDMPQQPEETTLVVKFIMYVGGVCLGLAAKLATQNKLKTITWKDIVLQSSIAFSCAWLVWYALAYLGRPDLANVVSVIVGRFADTIILIFWKSFKKAFFGAAEEIEKID